MTGFNPFNWLEQFQKAGGGFVNDGETTRFCWVKPDPEDDAAEAGRLLEALSSDPVRLAAVQAIVAGGPMETRP